MTDKTYFNGDAKSVVEKTILVSDWNSKAYDHSQWMVVCYTEYDFDCKPNRVTIAPKVEKKIVKASISVISSKLEPLKDDFSNRNTRRANTVWVETRYSTDGRSLEGFNIPYKHAGSMSLLLLEKILNTSTYVNLYIVYDEKGEPVPVPTINRDFINYVNRR